MKTARFVYFLVIPLLFACSLKKPEMPLAAAPAGPLLQELERRRQSFSTLKAIASMEVVKGSRKRTFDTVGIAVDHRDRLRIEAYGPFGQSLFAIVWNGQEILMRRPGEDKIVRTGSGGLAGFFGEGLDVSELSAILSGNITVPSDAAARLLCGKDGMCVLELQTKDSIRKVRVSCPPADNVRGSRVLSYALYQSGKMVFQAHFDRFAVISRYALPVQIVIENPDKKLRVSLTDSEADVNIPLHDEAFTLPDAEDR